MYEEDLSLFQRSLFQRLFLLLALIFLLAIYLPAEVLGGSWIGSWHFGQDLQGWVVNRDFDSKLHANDGVELNVRGTDPHLTSPVLENSVLDRPEGSNLTMTFRLRSTAGSLGQVYFGTSFSEEKSLQFTVQNDGQWHDYHVAFRSEGSGMRVRLDPSQSEGTVGLEWIIIRAQKVPPQDRWAKPVELVRKKMIGGGLYTIYGEETAITPRYLAQHPEFVERYPYDGIVLPVLLSPTWTQSLSLTKLGMPLRVQFLNELVWNRVRIPYEAVQPSIVDLQLMRRGSMTDNFLLVGMVDGARGLLTPNLALEEDWAIVRENARMAARICREGGLKGIWLDTEQYGHYRWRTESGVPEFDPAQPQGLHFPLGKDPPELLRLRGRDWIEAMQTEFPEMILMTTFAWSPDSESYGPLKGVVPFLDGVLEGIRAPARMVHGHENTFYFGHAPNTTHTYAQKNGFPGDRNRYDLVRKEIRGWRSFSKHPEKYDAMVQVGMAAWVEDHPWNLPDGWPLGSKATLWSNLPLALAYSDEYVWVWSEHTKYGQPHLQEMNPFLASLRNRTRNLSIDPILSFQEDFANDPMEEDWSFDFDMLAIGKKSAPDHEAETMSLEKIPFRWDHEQKFLHVVGQRSPKRHGQRQRFSRPVSMFGPSQRKRLVWEFEIESLGADPDDAIVLGLFHSDRLLEDHSVVLRIDNRGTAEIVVSNPGMSPRRFPLDALGMIRQGKYTFEISYSKRTDELQATLFHEKNLQSQRIEAHVSNFGPLDEAGVAIIENSDSAPTAEHPYRYRVFRIAFLCDEIGG